MFDTHYLIEQFSTSQIISTKCAQCLIEVSPGRMDLEQQ